MILAILLLAFFGTLLSAGTQGDDPVPEDSRKEDAARFNTTAMTVLAAAYPYLAEAVADELGLRDRSGIGIDIGGGPGDLVLELSRLTPGFYWIDADLNPYFAGFLFQGALDRGYSGRVSFIQADVHKLPFRSDFADVVVSRGSLQQWQDWEQAFSEILRVLKPGGKAYIGRGFSANLPLDVAREVRLKQGGGPRYDPDEFARRLRGIMNHLGISKYELKRPKSGKDEVNYGVWIVFGKPE